MCSAFCFSRPREHRYEGARSLWSPCGVTVSLFLTVLYVNYAHCTALSSIKCWGPSGHSIFNSQLAPDNKHPVGQLAPDNKHPVGQLAPDNKHPVGQLAPDNKHPVGQLAPDNKHPAGQLAPDNKHPVGQLAPDNKHPVGQLAPDNKHPAGQLAPDNKHPVGQLAPDNKHPAGQSLSCQGQEAFVCFYVAFPPQRLQGIITVFGTGSSGPTPLEEALRLLRLSATLSTWSGEKGGGGKEKDQQSVQRALWQCPTWMEGGQSVNR